MSWRAGNAHPCQRGIDAKRLAERLAAHWADGVADEVERRQRGVDTQRLADRHATRITDRVPEQIKYRSQGKAWRKSYV